MDSNVHDILLLEKKLLESDKFRSRMAPSPKRCEIENQAESEVAICDVHCICLV